MADDTLGLYVVADGVGGHAKGEVASAESVEQVRNFVCAGHDAIDGWLHRTADVGEEREAELRLGLRRLLEGAVQSACYVVYGMAEQDPSGQGMSTTLSALLVVGDYAVIAQVGDSRVYLCKAGVAEQVTTDHTLINHKLAQGLITAEQARTMAGRNLITRAVGHRDYVQVDTFAVDLEAGDRFLICSDGLHGYVELDEVEELLGLQTVEEATGRAIDRANERGGKDNITAVVIAIHR